MIGKNRIIQRLEKRLERKNIGKEQKVFLATILNDVQNLKTKECGTCGGSGECQSCFGTGQCEDCEGSG